jgi:uncharacterized protein
MRTLYWRERNREVDFVARVVLALTVIKAKSGRRSETNSALAAFAASFKPTRELLVGGDGIPTDEFLLKPVCHWVGR